MDQKPLLSAEPVTKGVQILRGDPKRAIIKLALPMVFAMTLNSLYNIIDRIWVSGLGGEALAATGYFFPMMLFAMAFAVGIGVGGGAAVSRRIGARDKAGANNAALQTQIISFVVSILFTAVFVVFGRELFLLMGAGNPIPPEPGHVPLDPELVLQMTVSYGMIMIAGSIFLFFMNTGNALLRSEGNATKAMIAIVIGVTLNIGLDPLFIYPLGLGISGAALASVISMGIASLLLAYWLMVEKKSYLDFHFKGFRFDRAIFYDIMRVGVPSILMQGAMSLMMFLIIIILNVIGGSQAVAVFNSGWSIVTFAILPLLGMGTAVTSVSAAAFGAGEYGKLNTVHKFSAGLGLGIEIVIAALVAFGAPLITLLFTWSPETGELAPEITGFLHVIWFFFPATAGGITSSAFFQGVGKGVNSLIITLLRTMVFAVFLAYLFGIAWGWGELGVYYGIITASWLSSIIAFIWVSLFIRKLNRREAAV
ncbi:MAG TPA: MATE family efflux transporter [Spirochaetia bacterium]|nr:MATE family efflux transporter [Spirochaetia bacterium]